MPFGRRTAASPPPPPSASPKWPQSPSAESLKRAMEDKRAADPLIGAKIGSKEIVAQLVAGMKNERGVHIESLLGLLGSLAGFACIASIHAEAVRLNVPMQMFGVLEIGSKGTGRHYIGDGLNARLLTDQVSVWGLVAGMAHHLGAKRPPDLNELVDHAVRTMGGPQGGVPRLPPEHPISRLPIEFVRDMWPALADRRDFFCAHPREWPILFAMAAQQVMEMGRGVLDPELALTIVMECAVPMSKVDPETIG